MLRGANEAGPVGDDHFDTSRQEATCAETRTRLAHQIGGTSVTGWAYAEGC